MKILDVQGYKMGDDWYTDRDYQLLVYEPGLYSNKWSSENHTKDTLSPVFGKHLNIYNEYEFICLDNYIGIMWNGNSNRADAVWSSSNVSHFNFGNNGQYNLLNENKLTRVWQSIN